MDHLPPAPKLDKKLPPITGYGEIPPVPLTSSTYYQPPPTADDRNNYRPPVAPQWNRNDSQMEYTSDPRNSSQFRKRYCEDDYDNYDLNLRSRNRDAYYDNEDYERFPGNSGNFDRRYKRSYVSREPNHITRVYNSQYNN